MHYTVEQLEAKNVAELQVIYRDVAPNPYRVTKKRKDELIDAILEAQYIDDDNDNYEDSDTKASSEDICGVRGTFMNVNLDGDSIGKIKVVSGFTSKEMNIVGQNLESVMNFLRPLFHVDEKTPVLVKGETIMNPSKYILKEGDVIEFVKTAGEKGIY